MFTTFFILCLTLLAVTPPSESQRRGGPRVVTEPESFEVYAGSSVTLPCAIRNVGRRSVFWFKGDDPEGRELIMQMKSVRGEFTVPRQYQSIIDLGKLATEGSNLIINDVGVSDQDAYTCSVAWARQSVTHTLTIRSEENPPVELQVTAVPSDGHVSVVEGLPTSISCVPSGSLPTTVSWYKEVDPNILTIGSVFNIAETSRDDSGRYICRAENDMSTPVTFAFDLNVEFLDVEADVSEVVASGTELTVELTCRISGYPDPQIAWYTASGPLTEDERHRTFAEEDLHYLQITDLTSADLGEYECYGYNDYLRDHATIMVTAAPGPVTILDVSRVSSDAAEDMYVLLWEVNSLEPIKYYNVALKEGSFEAVVTTIVAVEGSPPVLYDGMTLYRGSGEFDLTAGQTYEIMINAVTNDYQSGPDQREPYIFDVPLEITTPSFSNVTTPPPEETEEEVDEEGEVDEDEEEEEEEELDEEEEEELDEEEEEDDISPITKADAWKWWKVTMTILSRLPQVARMIQ